MNQTTGFNLQADIESKRSRLEMALRLCSVPKRIIRFRTKDIVTAQKMFSRICELIPRQFIKHYGLLSIIFSNDSRIEVTVD